jgi:hypothetical protein
MAQALPVVFSEALNVSHGLSSFYFAADPSRSLFYVVFSTESTKDPKSACFLVDRKMTTVRSG